MICYRLKCTDGHGFEGWFASSSAFDDQRAAGALECPICGSSKVDRALMAPAIASGRRDARRPHTEPAEAPPASSEAAVADGGAAGANDGAAERPPAPVPRSEPNVDGDDGRRLRAAVRALHQVLRQSGTNVGRDFPEHARAIHYGEREPSQIYGQADPDEARELIEEGVSIMPLPPLPEEKN